MLVVTTPMLDGIRITQYRGAIFAQVVRGFAIGQGFFDSFRAIGGDRSKGHEELIQHIRFEALEELKREAANAGGNAIVGAVIDVEAVSLRERPMLLAKAYGTAVVI